MTESVGIMTAFVAGLVSFLSPCHLALVPGYVSYLAGFTLTQTPDSSPHRVRLAAFANIFTFAVGFTAVFVFLGASLGALSQGITAAGPWLNRVSGVFIIALGLVTVGLLRIPVLERGYGPQFAPSANLRYVGSFLVGATFALGWTPCVGPLLGAIFVLAGTSGSAGQGSLLLTAYAAGLMLPLLAVGTTTGWTSWLLRSHGRWLTYANQMAGGLLVGLGIALFTGLLTQLSAHLALGV